MWLNICNFFLSWHVLISCLSKWPTYIKVIHGEPKSSLSYASLIGLAELVMCCLLPSTSLLVSSDGSGCSFCWYMCSWIRLYWQTKQFPSKIYSPILQTSFYNEKYIVFFNWLQNCVAQIAFFIWKEIMVIHGMGECCSRWWKAA